MPVLYIIRGLPGAGKTTLAEKLVDKCNIFEADQFFTKEDGTHEYDPSLIKDAHFDCCYRLHEAMWTNRGKDKDLAVSNTFTCKWEYIDYINLAGVFKYDVIILECHSNFESIHNIPKDKMEQMRSRWEPTNFKK